MKAVARLLIFAALSIFASTVFEGCRAVRNVATTSYRVATAPVHFIRRKVSEPAPGPRTTTTTETTVTRTTRTTAASDVTSPGHPVASSSPKRPGRLIGTSSSVVSASPTPMGTRIEPARTKTKASQPQTASAQAQFPTGKPVPGKPGYVFSPFDPKGRYVDVSGYTPGSKVKDPWTDKIFIVP
jgi:hypothetical protein